MWALRIPPFAQNAAQRMEHPSTLHSWGYCSIGSRGRSAPGPAQANPPSPARSERRCPVISLRQDIMRCLTLSPAPITPIAIRTLTGDVQVLRALKAGARGYILKGHVHRELLEAIRAVHTGQKRIPPEIAVELADHATDDELTQREVDVLRLIATGNANKQIAEQLSIGEATVKGHITNILSKLAANDRTHAVTIGLKRGIIELPGLSMRGYSGGSTSDLRDTNSDDPKVLVSDLPKSVSAASYYISGQRTDHLGLSAWRNLSHTSAQEVTEFH
jgi:DNA-binding CsgD family transcriptional regulator